MNNELASKIKEIVIDELSKVNNFSTKPDIIIGHGFTPILDIDYESVNIERVISALDREGISLSRIYYRKVPNYVELLITNKSFTEAKDIFKTDNIGYEYQLGNIEFVVGMGTNLLISLEM